MDKRFYPGISSYAFKNISIGTSLLLVLILILATTTSGCTDQTQQSIVQQEETIETVEITDMLGRNLTVPSEIDSLVTSTGPYSILVYMLAPEKLAGWNTFTPVDNMLMDERYTSLLVVGSWGAAQTANYETVISLDPEIVIEGYTVSKNGQISEQVTERQEKFGSIPVVAINGSIIAIEDGDDTIEYLGQLLDCEEQATEFISFRSSVLNDIEDKVNNIPDDEKVRVYYAEGSTCLKTDPSGSLHSEVIDICGGINVADCQVTTGMGMTPVSIEQVAEWNPEVIMTTDSEFYNSIYSDPLWANIDAVQNELVYLAPQNPFCWIDRPYGVHRVIGAAWTANVLYPELFSDTELEELTREFYSEFFHYELSDEELDKLLHPETEVSA
nr:iron ABC transporter substrate-binding protein [uncultured Methanolobus sp.]